jgi:hypothetical protein
MGVGWRFSILNLAQTLFAALKEVGALRGGDRGFGTFLSLIAEEEAGVHSFQQRDTSSLAFHVDRPFLNGWSLSMRIV